MADAHPTILIVEDDHFLSSILKSRLEKEGFAVLQAFDGDEALLMLKTVRPNVILLDIIMPKMSGFEVLEKVSSDPELSKIPVVIASNLGQDTDIEKAKALGASDYYVKVRTSLQDFIDMLKNVITKAAKNG